MKTINLENLSLSALTPAQLEEVDGGFLPLLLVGAALLLASCTSSTQNASQGGADNSQVNVKCTNCTVITVVKGDTTTTQVIKSPK